MRLLDSGHNLLLPMTISDTSQWVLRIRDLCYFKVGIRDLKAKWGRARDAGYRKYKSLGLRD